MNILKDYFEILRDAFDVFVVLFKDEYGLNKIETYESINKVMDSLNEKGTIISNTPTKEVNLERFTKKYKTLKDFIYPITIKNSSIESINGKLLNISVLNITNIEFFKISNEFSVNLYCSSIYKKLLINNCNIKKDVNLFSLYCLGEVIIENNVFEEFVDFGDCWFKEEVIIRNNIFKKGTNLLGNINKPYKVVFDKKPTIENNTGKLDLNILP